MACSVVQNRIQQLLGRFTWIVFQIQLYIETALPTDNKIRSQCSQADLRSHILNESQGFRSVFKRSFFNRKFILHVESLLSPLFIPFPLPVPPRPPDTARCRYFCKDISIHRMRRICRIRRMLRIHRLRRARCRHGLAVGRCFSARRVYANHDQGQEIRCSSRKDTRLSSVTGVSAPDFGLLS